MTEEVIRATSKTLTTREDVKAFFEFMTNEMELNFHPDNDISDYVNEYNEPFFNEWDEAALSSYLDSCHTVCYTLNIDIYEIALEINK